MVSIWNAFFFFYLKWFFSLMRTRLLIWRALKICSDIFFQIMISLAMKIYLFKFYKRPGHRTFVIFSSVLESKREEKIKINKYEMVILKNMKWKTTISIISYLNHCLILPAHPPERKERGLILSEAYGRFWEVEFDVLWLWNCTPTTNHHIYSDSFRQKLWICYILPLFVSPTLSLSLALSFSIIIYFCS